jgi:membrane fusion protein, copper/silver efflux system
MEQIIRNYRPYALLAATVAGAVLLSATAAPASAAMEAFNEGMRPILADYLMIQDKLAADSTAGVAAQARSIARAASNLRTDDLTGEHAAHLKEMPASLHEAAQGLSDATDIESARQGFRELSRPMAMWAAISQPPGVSVVFCSMAQASWLQPEGDIRNPYYGGDMHTCGQVVSGAGHAPMPMMHEGHPQGQGCRDGEHEHQCGGH